VKKFSVLFGILISTNLSAEIHLSSEEAYTQENALAYCRDLGPSWRPLVIGELYGLSQTIPFKEGYSYWSSSRVASGDAITGTGSEGDGGVIAILGYSFYPKERNISLSPLMKKIAAACTNVPKTFKKQHLTLTKEGALDKTSGLLWHSLDATDKKAKYSYERALEMCENLTLHGRIWRLPSSEELYSIVDTTFLRPSVDMKYFGPMMHRYYWSSDSLNSQEAYAVGFKLGSVATVSKKEEAYVRCVSDTE
jgi:hypothetical protein